MVKNIIVQKLTKDQQNTLKKASAITGETSASKTIFSSLERVLKLDKEYQKLVDKHTDLNNRYNKLINATGTYTSMLNEMTKLSKDKKVEIF